MMIKELKDSLKKVLQSSFDELQSIVAEEEAVLNSKPLCHVADEIETVLTPPHFFDTEAPDVCSRI